MKKVINKIIIVLIVVMTMASPVSFTFMQAQAYGSISYALNSDGKSYCVSDCDDNYFGRAKISATYDGLPVTKIADKAFDNSDIYEVVIPSSVTEIGAYAFSGCEKLKTVGFSDGVTEIKPYAFANCTRLREISIPASVNLVGDYVFTGCTSLTKVFFEGRKTEISIFSDAGRAEGAVVLGYSNSTAEKYALNNNIEFDSIVCDKAVIHTPQSTADGIVLTWDKVANASSYRVYRKAGNETSWTFLSTVTRTKYTDKNVVSGENYIYTVKACNNYVDGEYDRQGVDTRYLKAPVLTSVSSDKKGVTVKWEAVKGAQEYNVYHKTGFGSWVKVGTTTSTSFVDKTAQNGKTYTYTVTASAKVYRKTATSYYDTTGLKVKVEHIATPAIESVLVTDLNEITVKWNINEGADSYLVYRSEKSDSGFIGIAKVKTNSYKDTSVEFGKKYYYKVIVVDNDVQSEASSARGRTATVPAPVIDKNIFATSDKVTITWGKVSGASGYCLYRYDSAKKDWVKIATLRGNSNVSYTDKRTGVNKYRVYAFRTVNGKDYAGAYSAVLTTDTFKKPTLSVKQYESGLVNQVTWTPISNATGYLLYYKEGDTGKWTRAAILSSRITSYTMNVNHGVYYYWRVRPFIEKDGFTIGGSYSNTDDVMIYYTPSLRVAVSKDKVEGAKTVSITIENKGACPVRILKENAYIYNGPDKIDSYGTISLIDSTGKKLDYQDIAPGKTATVTFLLDGVKKGYYDSKTLIQFYFNYDNMKYILQTDPSLTGSQARYQLA